MKDRTLAKKATGDQVRRWQQAFNKARELRGVNEAAKITDLTIRHLDEHGCKDWGPSYEYGIAKLELLAAFGPGGSAMDDTEYNEIIAAQEIVGEQQ